MAGKPYSQPAGLANRTIDPIAEVARRSGWPDPDFFARAFPRAGVAAGFSPSFRFAVNLNTFCTFDFF